MKVKKEKLEYHLQPIRYFVLAKVLYAFLKSGIYKIIQEKNPTISELYKLTTLRSKIVRGIIQYLINENILTTSNEEKLILGREYQDLELYTPWYDLLLGGYSQTFDQIENLLESKVNYATRNSGLVGIGSCGISQFDALPMTMELLEFEKKQFTNLVDIGCGDGSFLIDICKQNSNINGIGLDISTESIERGNKIAADLNIADRVKFKYHQIGEVPHFSDSSSTCFIAAFLLQEILEQEGEDGVDYFLQAIFNTNPKASLIVIEVENKFHLKELFKDDLAKAYYNPYYLIHYFTEQRLETINFWTEIFSRNDLRIQHTVYPKDSYDPLKLKTGLLVKKK